MACLDKISHQQRTSANIDVVTKTEGNIRDFHRLGGWREINGVESFNNDNDRV